MDMGMIMLPGITIMPTADSDLFDLMSWMSPAWPIGAFAHSSGLEWAVEAGHVTDRASTSSWIGDALEHGAVRNDIVLFTHAWRAASDGDTAALADLAELALAAQTTHERLVESTAQGSAFARIARSASAVAGFAALIEGIDPRQLPYPVIAAALFACRGISLERALTAWLHGAVSNLVSAAQRLVPLGQTDGQLVITDCRNAVFAAVEAALALPLTDPFEALGGCTLIADLGCMAHETQYTRLFRT